MVSPLLGHESTETTRAAYARVPPLAAGGRSCYYSAVVDGCSDAERTLIRMKHSTQRQFKTREQELRAARERAANEAAKEAGSPLPFPNLWDELDPTKLPRDASDEAIQERYREFCKLCPPTPRKKHVL